MRLPKSLAVRVGGVAAAAAIAATGVAAASSASTAAPAAPPAARAVDRIPTTLTMTNSKPVARPHQTTAIVNGHLTTGSHDLRRLRVWLQRLGPKGHWRITQTKLTRRHGHVFFRVHVHKKAATFRLVFRGTRNFAKSVSRTDTISPATGS